MKNGTSDNFLSYHQIKFMSKRQQTREIELASRWTRQEIKKS